MASPQPQHRPLIDAGAEIKRISKSLSSKMKAARELIEAYPPKLCCSFLSELNDMTDRFGTIIRATKEPTSDKSAFLADLTALNAEFNYFEDRLQLIPPTQFSISNKPLTDSLPSTPELDSLLKAAFEISNRPNAQKAAELAAHYDSCSYAFASAINAHFKEGAMVAVLQSISDGLAQKGFYFGLKAAKEGDAGQKIIIWNETGGSFHEQDAGNLAQPTSEKQEGKFFSLRIDSSGFTTDPLGWLTQYAAMHGVSLQDYSTELAQAAKERNGIQGFSVTIGCGGEALNFNVIFSDSSALKFKKPTN